MKKNNVYAFTLNWPEENKITFGAVKSTYRSLAIFSQSVSSVNSRLKALVLRYCVG